MSRRTVQCLLEGRLATGGTMTRNKHKLIGWRPTDRDRAVLDYLSTVRPDESPSNALRRSIRTQAKADGLRGELTAFTPETQGRPKESSEPKQLTTKRLATNRKRKAKRKAA